MRATEPPAGRADLNRTREVHDAVESAAVSIRWIAYPSFERNWRSSARTCRAPRDSRAGDLDRPGASGRQSSSHAGRLGDDRLVAALVALDREMLDPQAIDETIGVVLKAREDIEALRGPRAVELLERAAARSGGAQAS